MNNTKPWPCDIGTTLEKVSAHIDAQHVYRDTRRVTLAAPGPQEIEPDEQPHALRQAADQQAQHTAYMAAQARLYGTGEVAEDDEASGPVGILDALLWWARPVAFVAGFLALVAVVITWRAQ